MRDDVELTEHFLLQFPVRLEEQHYRTFGNRTNELKRLPCVDLALLGSFSGASGIVLKRCWDRSQALLGSFSGAAWIVLRRCWDRSQALLGSVSGAARIGLRRCWDRSQALLGLFSGAVGIVLGR